MGIPPHEAQESIRLSLGRATSEQDIDSAVQALVDNVERLRRISSVREGKG
jgi:cysteine sulfinate desulfinase/cysteine desulfurase-like protein